MTDTENSGSSVVGTAASGEVITLHISVKERAVNTQCRTCYGETKLLHGAIPGTFTLPCAHDSFKLLYADVIVDARLQGASSATTIELLKGTTLEEAEELTHLEIVKKLHLSPAQAQSAALIEHALKVAVATYRTKNEALRETRAPRNDDTYIMVPRYKREQIQKERIGRMHLPAVHLPVAPPPAAADTESPTTTPRTGEVFDPFESDDC